MIAKEAKQIPNFPMYKTGEFTQQEIADVYYICGSSVNHIINKKTWKHIWR